MTDVVAMACTVPLCLVPSALALDNGLALTPPMGWLSWLRFGCTVDCDKYPKECLSEDLIKRTADRMVADGYRDAGYEYVIIDDCWLEKNRSADGLMVPDRKRFKSGMKALADYIHSKKLKFGIYQDIGTRTCEGYPGLRGHEKLDVKTFAEWGVDYIKVDGCYLNPTEMDKAYPALGTLLNATGRPMVYSCSWPAYQDKPDYAAIKKNCNLWRNHGDIAANWGSILGIMDWFGDRPELQKYAGPGHFNDPDMLVVGNKGLSVEESFAQLTVWTTLAAPFLISVDLDEIKPEFRELLFLKSIIKALRDPLGKAGLRLSHDDQADWWVRRCSKYVLVAIVNRTPNALEQNVTFDNMLLPGYTYKVKEIYNQEETFEVATGSSKLVTINPRGAKLYKIHYPKGTYGKGIMPFRIKF